MYIHLRNYDNTMNAEEFEEMFTVKFKEEADWEAHPEKKEAANERQVAGDRKSTRLNSSHTDISRMPSSA